MNIKKGNFTESIRNVNQLDTPIQENMVPNPKQKKAKKYRGMYKSCVGKHPAAQVGRRPLYKKKVWGQLLSKMGENGPAISRKQTLNRTEIFLASA